MLYVGIDYHKNYSYATKMDERGEILEQLRFMNDQESIEEFANTLPEDSKLVLEATGSWYYFFEQMENKVKDIILSNPIKTRAIAEARIKTDKIDSETLAHLLRTDLIPCSYIPKREIRDLREILRYRASLITLRTMIKNKIHAILSKNGIKIKYSDIFGKRAFKYLEELELRDCYKKALTGYLEIAKTLTKEIGTITEVIEQLVEENEDAKLLTTIPGIGYYSALLIVSEIGDINRFPSSKQLCSYAGLVPSVYSSGGKTYHGRITKQGSKWIRSILIELSIHFIKSSKHLKNLYGRLKIRKGSNLARVAVAREMLRIIYSMLKDKRPFKIDTLVVS